MEGTRYTRRSARVQKQSEQNHDLDANSQKKLKTTPENEAVDDEQCEDLNMEELTYEKPKELLFADDVDGKKMYNFTVSKKDAMMQKAIQSRCKETTVTDKMKVPVVCLVKSEKGIWGSKSGNTKESTSNESENKENLPKKSEPNIVKNNSPPLARRLRSRLVKDYHVKAEEYFATQSEKTKTSNHTLSKLRNRHLKEEELQQLLANKCHISTFHQDMIQTMSEALERQYKEWFRLMEEGFTVLLYGVGSKRLLINNFYKKAIPDEPTLIINGFFPSLTIKEILDNIITELMGLEAPPNQNECFDKIESTMMKYPDDRIYLLIHNLDGGMLRSDKAQDVLSRLANIPNVHVLASVDHINAALIWDNVKRARYNFFWKEATTFLPYEAETSYESSLLVQKSGALALLSLQNVFASLTKNAKSIYIILIKYQLENGGKNYNGMAFKDLYRAAREGFHVSSDQALRAQLGEFTDHKLAKFKRNIDGVESLIIPLDDALLKQFLEQYNNL